MIKFMRAIVLIYWVLLFCQVAQAQHYEPGVVKNFQYEGRVYHAYLHDGTIADVVPYLPESYTDNFGSLEHQSRTRDLQQMIHLWLAYHGAGWLPGCQTEYCALRAPQQISIDGLITTHPARVQQAGGLGWWDWGIFTPSLSTVGRDEILVFWIGL